MRLTALLLLPGAFASTLTIWASSVPSHDASAAPIPSPIPLAQISYDTSTLTGTISSYTPPTGSYAPDHYLRVGLSDPWRGVVTSAASFDSKYSQKFTLHVDEKGEVYHVGFGASLRSPSGKGTGNEEVAVEVVKRQAGSKPVLNRPIVLNAEGKLETKEPEKTFLQKYWWAIALFILVQLVAGGGGKE